MTSLLFALSKCPLAGTLPAGAVAYLSALFFALSPVGYLSALFFALSPVGYLSALFFALSPVGYLSASSLA